MDELVRPSYAAMMNVARMVGIVVVALAPAQLSAQTTTTPPVSAVFGGPGSLVACGDPISAAATLTNSSSVTAYGNIVLNGAAPVPFTLPGNSTKTLGVAGGTLDCTKAPDLVAKVNVAGSPTGKGAYTITKTLPADTVKFPSKDISVGNNMIRVVPGPAKCGGALPVAAKSIYGIPFNGDLSVTVGTNPAVTKPIGSTGATIEVTTFVVCSAPLPKFSFAVANAGLTSPTPSFVTYK